MEDKSFNKIFGIGYQKTGTKSLHVYIESLGFDMLHDIHSLAPEVYTNGDFKGAIDDYDGIINMYHSLFIEMDQQYPNSKFILTTRDNDMWWRSVREWRNGDYENCGPAGHTELETAGYVGMYKSFLPTESAAKWHKLFHENNVIDYFEKMNKVDNLLVLDVDEENSIKANRVSEFLDCDTINAYEHHNNSFKAR